MTRPPFLQRLHLRQFRSIRDETVTFANPLFLVGRNGAGKSNLVDALAFLSECMTLPLRTAIENRIRGEGALVFRDGPRASDRTANFAIRADFRLDGGRGGTGHYSFAIGFSLTNGWTVLHEQCVVDRRDGRVWFDREGGRFDTSLLDLKPAVDPQSLALPIVGGIEQFAPLLKALTAMRVYAIDPDKMREMQRAGGDPILKRDGSNAANVLLHLARRGPDATQRVSELLSAVTPDLAGVFPVGSSNSYVGLRFALGRGENSFDGYYLSDGTLMVLGLILAAVQEPAPSLIAFEEPEIMIYPGAIGTVADIIETAAHRSQVVIATHSPDLIDQKWIQPEHLRIVDWVNGSTKVSELGTAPIKALQQHLMLPGELLRANALDSAQPAEEQSSESLFDQVPA